MFYNDHAPPHIHVKYAEYEAKVDIATLSVIDGRLPRRVERMVRQWGLVHRTELEEDWELARNTKAPKPIEGLA